MEELESGDGGGGGGAPHSLSLLQLPTTCDINVTSTPIGAPPTPPPSSPLPPDLTPPPPSRTPPPRRKRRSESSTEEVMHGSFEIDDSEYSHPILASPRLARTTPLPIHEHAQGRRSPNISCSNMYGRMIRIIAQARSNDLIVMMWSASV